MMETLIIKYGGSFVMPDKTYNLDSLEELKRLVLRFPKKRFVFVIGGGKLARNITKVSESILDDALEGNTFLKGLAFDELGIAVTKINGRFVLEWLKTNLGNDVVFEDIVDYPLNVPSTSKRVIIATGYKPGVSTDYDMMLLAKAYGASKVFKISNFPMVLDVKPENFKKELINSYKPIKNISWAGMKDLVGESFIAGGNYPLDPPSTRLGNELHKINHDFKLYIGQKEELIKMILDDEFVGTIVSG